MRKAGIPISLGVDGCATNDGSNMLDTLRLSYLMQTFLSKQRGGCPSPYDMLKLATAGGADMIGRPELGRLTAGKAADLFMIDTRRLEYAGALHDPASMLAKLGVTSNAGRSDGQQRSGTPEHGRWPHCLSGRPFDRRR